MVPYAPCFLNTIFVAFVGCVDTCISCTVRLVFSEYEMHLCTVLMDIRLHFPSDPLLTSASLTQQWNMLVGKLSFRAGTGGQEPVLAVEHKMVVERSTQNNYSLGLQKSKPG